MITSQPTALVLVSQDDANKQESKAIKLGVALQAVVAGWSLQDVKQKLAEIGESKNGSANYYRISLQEASKLMKAARRELWLQNKQTPRETFATYAARLDALYKAAHAEGNKSLMLAVTDRLMALHGVDKESMLQLAGEKSARLGQRLDAALGNLSRAIGALINENVPTAEQTALEDGSQPEPTAIDDSEL